MLCGLGLKLHRSLYIENYHGADDGAEKPQKHTQDMSRWMQSDTFRVQQTSHTNVCNPAVRSKSMTLHCYELAAELFASVMMEKETSHSPLFPPSVSARCDNSVPTPSMTLFRLLRFLGIVVLLVIGHCYKIQFLGPIKETHEYFLYIIMTDCDIYNHIWAQAWSVLCEGQQPLLPHSCLLLQFNE